MVAWRAAGVLDGDVGGAVERGRSGSDEWWSAMLVLQLVSCFVLFIDGVVEWGWLGGGADDGRSEELLTIWCSVIAFIGTILTAASLAEIASVYPTAGGTCLPFSSASSCLFDGSTMGCLITQRTKHFHILSCVMKFFLVGATCEGIVRYPSTLGPKYFIML